MKKLSRNISLFIIAIVLTFGFNLDVLAAGECGDRNSNQCRYGERGAIIVSGNGGKYFEELTDATENTRNVVSGTGEKKGDGSPWNKYKTIGVESTKDSGFSAYQDTFSALFCLDARYKGYAPVYASRFLMDTSENAVTRTMDVALMSVLLDGGITKDVNDIKSYWAKCMAIRAITYTFWAHKIDNDPDYQNAYKSSMTVTYEFNKKYASKISELTAAVNAAGATDFVAGKMVTNEKNFNFSGDPVDKAEGYYVRAIDAAIAYAKSLASQAKVDFGTVSAGEVETSGGKDNQLVKKDVTHTLKLSGFTKGNKFVINSNDNYGIKFEKDANYDGVTAYISEIQISGGQTISGRDQVATYLDKDLVELGLIPEKQDVEVKIIAHFEGYKTSTNSSVPLLKCGQQPIKYTIDGTYGVGIPDEFKNYVATIWYAGKSEVQRYIGIEERKGDNVDDGKPWESKYETYLIDSCSCEDLISACALTMDPNSDECIELKGSNCGECALLDAYCQMGDPTACDKHDLVCDLTCETEVQTFECCDAVGDSSFLDVSTADDHKVSILGPGPDNTKSNNIKACFVNKMDQLAELQGDGTYKNNTNIEISDQNKNSYALADVKSNQYCSVSCKEDYVMTMPTAKIVNAGRYFTFKANVVGTKVCYTNTIDREKYNKDIIDRQEDMINKYNEYRKWYELYHGTIEPVDGSYPGHSCTCDGHGCGPTCGSVPYYPQWRATATVNDWTDITAKPLETGVVSIRQHAQPVSDTNTYQVTTGASTHSCPGGTWTTTDSEGNTTEHSCSGGTTTYYTGHETACDEGCYRAILKSRMEAALAALITAQGAYRNTLKEYDDCSTWTSEINYDPEVYYDYVEDYMNMLANRIGQMDKFPNNPTPTGSEWYCNSRITNGSGNETTKAEITDKNYKNCKGNSGGQSKSPLNYIYCDEDSTCKITPEDVSDARYKKVTSEVSVNYKPATLFYNIYPSGEIILKGEANNNGTELKNSLPVALNTPRGIYKYTVNIENLGEFYDQAPKSNLGRYVGSSTAIADPKTLVYNCAYLVNITTINGWICDFDETCTDDCISNCVGPDCDGYCDGIDCVADCIGLGCIYDSSAGTSLIERLVSLNNLFPNGTSSYNWDRTRNDKALKTITSIESEGNAIYDKDPILSITITPGAANEIRKYNNGVLNDGGYSNDTVSCKDRNGVEQIACYSDVLTDIINGEFGKIVNNNSLILDDNYRFGENSEYFKLWDGRISEDDMIGPAWR